MKTFMFLALAVASLAAEPQNAVPQAPADPPFYVPKYFSFDTFVGVKTENFDDDGIGYYGLGAQAYWGESVGFGFEGLVKEQQVREDDGPLIDQTNLNLLIVRAVTPKLSYTLFAGGGREWANEEWLVDAGIRLDHTLFKVSNAELGVFGSGRWEKQLDKDQDHVGLFCAGIFLDF